MNKLINFPSVITTILIIILITLINNQETLSHPLTQSQLRSLINDELISEDGVDNSSLSVSNVSWNELSSSIINQQLHQLARERKRRERISFIRSSVLNQRLESNDSMMFTNYSTNHSILTNYSVLTNYIRNNLTDNDLINGFLSLLSSTPPSELEDELITEMNENISSTMKSIEETLFPTCQQSSADRNQQSSADKIQKPTAQKQKTKSIFQLPPPPSNQVRSASTAKLFLYKFADVQLQSLAPSYSQFGGQLDRSDTGLTISVYKISSRGQC